MMDRVQNLAQAYHQAPWRRQLQFIGLFLLVLVFMALVAGVYLNVTARAAALGREIQEMQYEIEAARQENANLLARLAQMTSSREMERRAYELGFRPIEMEEAIFLPVPGYQARSLVVLAPAPAVFESYQSTLPPEYTESLFSWLERQMFWSSFLGLEAQP
jgi:cell division protein FtsL